MIYPFARDIMHVLFGRLNMKRAVFVLVIVSICLTIVISLALAQTKEGDGEKSELL